ncbi:ComEA family DNA-binding protein [Halioxenophilus aromaticivorans]|uniref:Helix-hairpin-helix DNA-binding motif class 1 domain-containing protein n=1 Tax=Halioxenophilus aromaticivorans TaxID=1306992 RepID=A0AAV3U085_9ALTE
MKSLKAWTFAFISALFILTAAPQIVLAEPDAVLEAPNAININSASAQEISEALTGVGPAKAEAIVAWREEFGGFQHVEELEEVKGIGPSIVEKNKAKISLN